MGPNSVGPQLSGKEIHSLSRFGETFSPATATPRSGSRAATVSSDVSEE